MLNLSNLLIQWGYHLRTTMQTTSLSSTRDFPTSFETTHPIVVGNGLQDGDTLNITSQTATKFEYALWERVTGATAYDRINFLAIGI